MPNPLENNIIISHSLSFFFLLSLSLSPLYLSPHFIKKLVFFFIFAPFSLSLSHSLSHSFFLPPCHVFRPPFPVVSAVIDNRITLLYMMTMLVPSSNATVESQPPPPPTTTASTAIHTPSLFATTDEMPSGPPPSRSFSVMAPTELQRSVQRQYDTTTTTEDLPWWQHYYQMYHYHPPQGRKPTLFGPYLLLHTLGEGEFGKVKLGIHIDSSQEVSKPFIYAKGGKR